MKYLSMQNGKTRWKFLLCHWIKSSQECMNFHFKSNIAEGKLKKKFKYINLNPLSSAETD